MSSDGPVQTARSQSEDDCNALVARTGKGQSRLESAKVTVIDPDLPRDDRLPT